ncbi:hypothetical protein FPV67DRAFT_643353 [Lyophyllum atratum]|nr:hypothetical protein FPV67DRAFT_643353 [Lyophyllum atratum]
MPPTAARPAPRKRVRKRKRRAVSESSSSSSSSESESEGEPPKPIAKPVVAQQAATSSSSESSTDSSSSSDSESEPEAVLPAIPTQTSRQPDGRAPQTRAVRHTSPSPSPPPAEIPPFINETDPKDKNFQEEMMKAKFRKFWMASAADGFRDDLEEIRKEPNLGTSRLSLLIDSLASGADVFASGKSGDINEMEIILD